MILLMTDVFQWLFLKKKRRTLWAIILIFLFSPSFFFFKEAFPTSLEKDFVEEAFEQIENELKASRQNEAKQLFLQLAQKAPRDTMFIRECSGIELTMENYPYYLYLLANDYIVSYSSMKAPQKGIRVLNKLIEQYPHSVFPDTRVPIVPSAHIKIAEALCEIDPLESIKTYQMVMNRYRDQRAHFTFYGDSLIGPLALLEIGYVYEYQLKDYQKAISFYRQVVEKYPRYFGKRGWDYPAATAQLRVIRIYRKHLDDYKMAIREAERLIMLEEHTFVDPTEERAFDCGQSRAEGFCKIGEIYQEIGQPSMAIKYFKEVINTYPDIPYGYFESEATGTYGERGMDGLRLSGIKALGVKWTLAELEKIERLHRSEPTRAYALYIIASIYEKELKNKTQAIHVYKKVLEKYPKIGSKEFPGLTQMVEERIKELTRRK